MIKWTEQEWRLFANKLLEKYPHLLTATHIPLGDGTMLKDAMQALPANRRRPVVAQGGKAGYLHSLLAIFKTMRAELENQGIALPDASSSTADPLPDDARIRWHEHEWELIARELLKIRPHLIEANTVGELDIFPSDMFLAQQVLDPARRRSNIPSSKARPSIFSALLRLRTVIAREQAQRQAEQEKKAKEAKQAESGRIIWTDDEWKSFALSVHSLAPQLDFLHSADLAGLNTTLMNKAAKAMPEHRQRNFPAIEVPRKKLLQIYAQARATRDPLFFPKPALAAQPAPAAPVTSSAEQPASRAFQRAPAPVAEQPTEFVVNAHRPAPVPEPEPTPLEQAIDAFARAPAPEVATAPSGNIFWTQDEWLAIATDLHRMYPLLNLLKSETLHGLTSPDVAFAQRVLPANRQRPKLKVVTFGVSLKPKLLLAFRQLRENLERPAPQVEQAAEAPAPQVEVAPRGHEELVPVEAQETAEGAFDITTDTATNPYEAAFKPLVDLFGTQLAAAVGAQVRAQLAPLTAQIAALKEQIAALRDAPQPRAQQEPVNKFGVMFQSPRPTPIPAEPVLVDRVIELSSRPAGASPRAPTAAATPSAPHIGIFGNRNKYKAELEHDFPGVRFTCVDSPKRIADLKNCDKAVGMIGWSSHSAIDKLKRTAGPRFVPVNGSLSDLKRTISIWIASNVIRPLLSDTTEPLAATA